MINPTIKRGRRLVKVQVPDQDRPGTPVSTLAPLSLRDLNVLVASSKPAVNFAPKQFTRLKNNSCC